MSAYGTFVQPQHKCYYTMSGEDNIIPSAIPHSAWMATSQLATQQIEGHHAHLLSQTPD